MLTAAWILALILSIGVILMIAYAHWIEPTLVQVRRYCFWHEALPEALSGTRLLIFSDLHFKGYGSVEQKKLQNIIAHSRKLPSDIQLFLGDFLHDDGGLSSVKTLLQALPPAPARLAVLGNHDYVTYDLNRVIFNLVPDMKKSGALGQRARRLARRLYEIWHLSTALALDLPLRAPTKYNDINSLQEQLQRAGVQVLHNTTWDWLDKAPDSLQFVGINDITEGDVNDPIALAPASKFRILLTHNPDGVLLQDWPGVQLVLSGHTHGGQIVLPVLGSVHSQGTHLGRKNASGWRRSNGRWLFVTCGLGESFPFRFGCRPELVQIELRRDHCPGNQRKSGWQTLDVTGNRNCSSYLSPVMSLLKPLAEGLRLRARIKK